MEPYSVISFFEVTTPRAVRFNNVRFIHKYKKWFSVDREVAQAKRDSYVRDGRIDRYYNDDGVLFLAAPVTGTHFKITGSRVGDKRSVREDRRIQAADQEAIREERNRTLTKLATNHHIVIANCD